MKKIKYIIILATILFVAGCSESFLDQKNLYDNSDESFYKTPEQIEQALAGAYAVLPMTVGSADGQNNHFMVAEWLGDDCFGGGGPVDQAWRYADNFELYNPSFYDNLFANDWKGILRANLIINRIDQAKYLDTIQKNQALGEAYFLRAFFYNRLSQFFGPVPLNLEPAPANLPRATAEVMYGQIAADLKEAIRLMPATSFSNISLSRLGHVNKWVAEAFMARVFLFYTGYYNQTEIVLPNGGAVSKADVINLITDCIDNSGYDLLPDFRQNWTYASADTIVYPYAAEIPVLASSGSRWAGIEGANYETMFAIKYSIFAIHSSDLTTDRLSYCNQHVLYSGLRQQAWEPFGTGWGGATVNPQIWDVFENGDIRRDGSILNINIANPNEGLVVDTFRWGGDGQTQESGLWSKKYMPIVKGNAGSAQGIFVAMYGAPTDEQRWNMQDDVILRFADVLLMAAELGAPNAQAYLDRVRDRAFGDADHRITATEENIRLERRRELAFEGLRYFDILRWHIAEEAIEKADGITLKDANVDAIYHVDFRPETGGFLPVPESEITLSNGILTQTPGWE